MGTHRPLTVEEKQDRTDSRVAQDDFQLSADHEQTPTRRFSM